MFYLQLKAGKTILTQNLSNAVQSVERKLILIPIIFILLRIWSLLLVVIKVEMNVQLNCVVVLFFLHIGVNMNMMCKGVQREEGIQQLASKNQSGRCKSTVIVKNRFLLIVIACSR